MRIAIVLNSFPEISEKFLLNAVIGFIKAGADIEIFAAHRPSTALRHEQFLRYDVEKYTNYVDIPRSMKRRIRAAPFLFVKLLVKNPKAAFEAIRFGKYRTVAKNLKLLYFGNRFADERFDVVHCHFGPNGLVGSYLKECGFCGHLVATFHGSDINTYPKKHGIDVYRQLYRSADLVTANTAFTKSRIVANGCPETLIRVIPVGLVVEDYADVDRSSVMPDSILTVGRLEEKKGHRYALEAIALVRKEIPTVGYHIAGDGSLAAALKAYAAELGIDDCVRFMGLMDSGQVNKMYATCSVFTLPSVTAASGDMEGQGLVIQEAQMCGMPVVSTLHNGIPDGLLDGTTGFLVPEKDPQSLADRLLVLLKDAALREKMGAAGKIFVAGKYDIEVITAGFMACFEKIHSGTVGGQD